MRMLWQYYDYSRVQKWRFSRGKRESNPPKIPSKRLARFFLFFLRFTAKNALENASVVVRLFARFVCFCVFKRERERSSSTRPRSQIHLLYKATALWILWWRITARTRRRGERRDRWTEDDDKRYDALLLLLLIVIVFVFVFVADEDVEKSSVLSKLVCSLCVSSSFRWLCAYAPVS